MTKSSNTPSSKKNESLKTTRRNFLKSAAALPVMAVAPGLLHAASSEHVVVIGGGFGGATVAKYIRLWSNNSIQVTLVDPKALHTSCIMSNLVVNNRLRLDQLKITYDSLRDTHGVTVLRDKAIDIDPAAHTVRLKAGGNLHYDKLILAPGIGFKPLEGWDKKVMPHAWIAGNQTTLLKRQVSRLAQDSTFIMTIPRSPYRCPPGPYERACLIADHFVRKGISETDEARVVILDANEDIQAERETFSKAFDGIYRNIIDYVPNTEVFAADASTMALDTSFGEYRADAINIIPNQRAAWLLRKTGLTDGGDWAPVDPVTYESSVYPDIHIIGDSQATKQPKSGHMANSQAKVCADAIVRLMKGHAVDSKERLDNLTTNSACFSPITYDEASWLSANFAYDKSSGRMKLEHIGEAHEWSKGNYKEMFAWASNLFNDSFI